MLAPAESSRPGLVAQAVDRGLEGRRSRCREISSVALPGLKGTKPCFRRREAQPSPAAILSTFAASPSPSPKTLAAQSSHFRRSIPSPAGTSGCTHRGADVLQLLRSAPGALVRFVWNGRERELRLGDCGAMICS